jgi:hypothetical protein
MEGYRAARIKAKTIRHAEKHAKSGVESCPDLVVTKLIGPVVEVDPLNNPSHARLLADAQQHPKLPEWFAELQRDEKAMTDYPSKWVLRAGFTLMLGAEFAGISQLLASQGMVNPERAIVAVAGACILFYLGYQASKEAAP